MLSSSQLTLKLRDFDLILNLGVHGHLLEPLLVDDASTIEEEYTQEPYLDKLMSIQVIIEELAKDEEKSVFWSINEEARESLLNLKNTTYHSRKILRISRLRRIQDHCLTLKNTSYPNQQIRRM
ncbi:hypothetical protein Tco_1205842 [Tanacetum coccineum]